MERVRNRPRHEIQCTIIPDSELEQLRISLKNSNNFKDSLEIEQHQRELLKQKSEARVKNWPNTIEALRLRKEVERRERMDREEEVRRALDAEEAQYQAAKREAAIERANLILYEQDDRIKTLTSKMLLSNVIEDRKKQIELKGQRSELDRQKEEAWNAQLQREVREHRIKERQEAQARTEKAQKTQKEQKGQLQEVEARLIKSTKDAREEGMQIRRAAEQAVREDRESDLKRRQEAQQLNREYNRANEQLKRMQEEQERLSQEEDEKIAEFAKIKEGQVLERKRRLQEKFRNDMERRQVQIEKQAAYIQTLRQQQEDRLNRQIEQVAAETETKEVEKQEKRSREWHSIVDSRSRQLSAKDTKRVQEASEELEFKQQRMQAAEMMKEEDERERQQRKGIHRRLFDFHQMQREDKTNRTKEEKAQDMLEGQMMKKALEEEEEMFSRYVNTVMAEYSTKGRDVSILRPKKRLGDTF